MRKTVLGLTILLLLSCSGSSPDLWSTYETLPLEVETREMSEDSWVKNNFTLSDGTYIVNKTTEEGNYAQRCSGTDDSVLFTFPVTLSTVFGATLANGSLYFILRNIWNPQHPSSDFQITKMDNETMAVQKDVFFPGHLAPVGELFFTSDDTSIQVVILGDPNFNLKYTFDLKWVDIAEFHYEEDVDGGNGLMALSNAKASLLTEDGIFFILNQHLFYLEYSYVTSFPFRGVISVESFENGYITFLQYHDSTTTGEESFTVDRVTYYHLRTIETRETLLTIDSAYLSSSQEKNNASFHSFALFDEDLFIVGMRNETKRDSAWLDFGVLRLDIGTSGVATYFKSGEHATLDDLYYYNGHFGYVSETDDGPTVRQINFRLP